MCTTEFCIKLAEQEATTTAISAASCTLGQVWAFNKSYANSVLGEWLAFLLFMVLLPLMCLSCLSSFRGVLRWCLADALKVKTSKSRH